MSASMPDSGVAYGAARSGPLPSALDHRRPERFRQSRRDDRGGPPQIRTELPQPISVPLGAVRWSEQRRLIVEGNGIGAGGAGNARPVPTKAVQPMPAQKDRRPASEI